MIGRFYRAQVKIFELGPASVKRFRPSDSQSETKISSLSWKYLGDKVFLVCQAQRSHNTVGSYSCGCRDGFTTADDQSCVDIDECMNNNVCPIKMLCKNFDGDYSCNCKSGFSGSACLDVDECASNQTNCDVNAKCLNSEGSYNCQCTLDQGTLDQVRCVRRASAKMLCALRTKSAPLRQLSIVYAWTASKLIKVKTVLMSMNAPWK